MPASCRNLAVLLLCGLVPQSSAEPAKTTVNHAGSIPVLNRVTFHGNVEDELVHVEHWVVLYCVDWYDPCQKMRQTYLDLASSYERKLNTDALLRLPVRFAEVDCQVDKVLCNEQLVDWYPALVHYHRGEKVARWVADDGDKAEEEEKMTEFLKEQMNFTAPQEDVIDSTPGNMEQEDIWNLPTAQQHPIKTAFRLAPLAAALVGMGVWILTVGAEVVQGLCKLLRSPSAGVAAAAAASPKKPLPQQQTPEASRGSLRHRLPESWARERRSIEL